MDLRIFDVEHGQCSHIVTDSGRHVLIDAGHNSSTNWRPSAFLPRQGITRIDKLIISNFDEDHASDLHNLVNAVGIGTLVKNPSVSAEQLRYVKDIGGIGRGIDALAKMMTRYTAPAASNIDYGDVKVQHFWNRYPAEFEDENNLSLVSIIESHGIRICFPGDMEVAGWEKLLEREAFREAIGRVDILVASHHGRRNGCSDRLFDETGLYPHFVVISDSGREYASQETVNWYRQRCRGIELDGQQRRVLTTRRDGRVRIQTGPGGATVDTF
ncbi:ComEC/Rec2 family competence protein [Mesorhizobium sp. PL10]